MSFDSQLYPSTKRCIHNTYGIESPHAMILDLIKFLALIFWFVDKLIRDPFSIINNTLLWPFISQCTANDALTDQYKFFVPSNVMMSGRKTIWLRYFGNCCRFFVLSVSGAWTHVHKNAVTVCKSYPNHFDRNIIFTMLLWNNFSPSSGSFGSDFLI